MRHGKKFNHLSRKSSHRKALLSNMASSLIKHKRITTTTAKAKELRKYIEPLITKSKDNTTHNRRVVFSYLQDKVAVTELFADVATKVASRPGGYTRILKIGNRLGDNADMAIIELVDYNELMLAAQGDKKPGTKKRRSRRGGGSKSAAASTEATATKAKKETEAKVEEKKEEAPKAEETPVEEVKAEEVVEETATEAKAEEVVEEAAPEAKAEEPAKEEAKEEPKAEKSEDAPEADDSAEEEKKD